MIPLRIPTAEELAPALRKLESEEGSLVVITIQARPDVQNFYDVQHSWFCFEDRQAFKRAIDRARTKRKDGARKASDSPSNTNTADSMIERQEEQP